MILVLVIAGFTVWFLLLALALALVEKKVEVHFSDPPGMVTKVRRDAVPYDWAEDAA